MSRFDNFIKGLAEPLSDDGRSSGRSDQRSVRERLHQQGRGNETVHKDDPERRAQLNRSVTEAATRNDAVPKPYDPMLLRDLASSAIPQSYIDTLSQDVASASWSIKPRDEDADIPEDKLAGLEREIKSLNPSGTWRDFLEQYTRCLLELGDTAAVKNYPKSGGDEPAEVMPVDSATFFKQVDRYGIVEGYLQASYSTGDVVAEFEEGEVIWQEWGSRPDRMYGQGPIEKAQKEIELLEELTEKERLDLVQGSPPGVISQSKTDEFGGMNDEDWANFVEQMKLDEGQRHRVGYSKHPIEFTPISHDYQEMQVLDRSKYWVTVLGAVLKVNPSYAGFDFENTNRATDETQQEAYAQRGFRTVLQLIEESINLDLIWSDYDEDVKFVFEREQTVAERKSRAELVESQAKAGKEMANAGREVMYRDGEIVVEDGEIEEGDAGSSGGGLFMSADGAPDTTAKDNDDGGDPDPFEVVDAHLYRAHVEQIQPESVAAIEKRSWTGDESVPQYVLDKIREVIGDGAVFDQFESLPGEVQDRVEGLLEDNLTQPQGWSLRSIVDDMSDVFPGVDKDDLEVVARTETATILNQAREEAYEERPESATYRFKWQGPDDHRTTPCCEFLKERTNPDYGGHPRTLPALIRLEEEAHDRFFDLAHFRDHCPHPNCRHTFMRVVDT